MAGQGAGASGMPMGIDVAGAWAYIWRLLRLDDRVFDDVAKDDAQTAAGFLLPLVRLLGTAITAWRASARWRRDIDFGFSGARSGGRGVARG